MSVTIKEFEHLRIRLGAIKSATNNFGNDSFIGKGGFGKVYKGELWNPMRTVAVKRLDRGFGQGDLEFWKEIMLLSFYKHENIVSLLGFCDENGEKILVYEYASNKSLDFYVRSVDLTWTQRLNICVGAARGLQYLHDPKGTQQRILHRDIKSSNVLLDENWNAKISDFGLSKIGPANQQYSFLMSNVVGTLGYCDPLYVERGLLTKESDVYSFGVVLFEVLCGRLCYDKHKEESQSFVGLVRQSFEENKLDEIVYDYVTEPINPDSLKAFATIAYKCLNRDHKERPTMTQIVKELEGALEFQFLESALRYDFGKLLFGCKHYRSRCKLRAPCCNRIFPCRRCHDECTSQLKDPNERHKMVFKDVNRVVCTICHAEQQATQICGNCGAKMGEYFCGICMIYDDDTSKQQFHCGDCGICRFGGIENYFHCQMCGGCFQVTERSSHTCLENALRDECPVCHENLLDSVKKTIIMHCRHAIHEDCYPEISIPNGCPICPNSRDKNLAKIRLEGSRLVLI